MQMCTFNNIWKIWILNLLWVLYFKLVNTFFLFIGNIVQTQMWEISSSEEGRLLGNPDDGLQIQHCIPGTVNGETFILRQATLHQLQAETNQLSWAYHYNS